MYLSTLYRASVGCLGVKMSRVVADSNGFVGDWASAVSQLFNFPESGEKLMSTSRPPQSNENKGVLSIPADILETPKEYIFYMDVPGLSKSDIQVHLSIPTSHIAVFIFRVANARWEDGF